MSFNEFFDDVVIQTAELYKTSDNGVPVKVKQIKGHLQDNSGRVEENATFGIIYRFYCDVNELKGQNMQIGAGMDILYINNEKYSIIEVLDKSYLDQEVAHFEIKLKKDV